jgi:transposase
MHYRRTAKKLYQELRQEGFTGAYTTVNAYVQKWKHKERLGTSKKAFVPQEYEPGEAFQFDWSEEQIELDGEWIKIKVAHIHLCYSGLFFMVAYRREALEMVMDAHGRSESLDGQGSKIQSAISGTGLPSSL